MLKEAIQYLLDLKRPETIMVDGLSYRTVPLDLVAPPTPEPIVMHTLTGLVDYLKCGIDSQMKMEGIVVHVVDHATVKILSKLHWDVKVRHVFGSSELTNKEAFSFGRFLGIEEFIIGIQSSFVQDETTSELLRLIGNIKDETVLTATDDGVSQTVTVKSGAALVANKKIPNPVMLRPYRTFREIEQPASPFVLRLRRSNTLPECAIFEAQGEQWKFEAITSIKDWLKRSVDVEVIA